MKKIKLVLVLVACLFGLTACGNTKPVDAAKAEELCTLSSQLCQYVWANPESELRVAYENEGASIAAEYAEEWFDYNGLKAEGYGVVAALDSYDMATDEIGSIVSINGSSAQYDSSGEKIIVTLNCSFVERDADVEFIYKDDLFKTFTSSATNINYTFGEKMAKAGLNTLLGMGTVFAVLILIFGIISLFNFIPKIEAALKKKDAQPAATSVDNAITQIVESEELTDDLELVAVISAAIAAYEGSASTDGYVVRSIRRVDNGSKWQRAL